MKTNEYIHKVHYYETDKMAVVHHSNYVRWMEEARIDFLAQIGWEMTKLEEMGIISPVTSVECKYKAMTKFADEIHIFVSVEEYKGVKLRLKYRMMREDEVVFEGHTEHCFLDANGKILRLKKEYPDFHETLTSLAD